MKTTICRRLTAVFAALLLCCGLIAPAAASAQTTAVSALSIYPYPMFWPRLAHKPFSCLWHSAACTEWEEYATVFESLFAGGSAGSRYTWDDAWHAAYDLGLYAHLAKADAAALASVAGRPSGKCGLHTDIQLTQMLNNLRSKAGFGHLMGAVLNVGLGRSKYGKFVYRDSATFLLGEAVGTALEIYARQEMVLVFAGLLAEGCIG